MKKNITIQAPASKSLSHRSLIAASLTRGTSIIKNVLNSDDLLRTRTILQNIGARIEPMTESIFTVTGVAGNIQGGASKDTAVDCNVHESGTTCRLLLGLLASGHGVFHFHGAERMYQRPMQELINALETQHVQFEYEKETGFLPLCMATGGLNGSSLSISLNESSQYLSGLILGACQTKGMDILLTGDQVVSWSYVSLTLQVLHDFGMSFTVYTRKNKDAQWEIDNWRTLAEIKPHCLKIHVPGGVLRAQEYAVEGDWSNASYFLAAGAVGKPLTMHGLKPDSLQGDAVIADILAQMGAHVQWKDTDIHISPPADGLKAITVDMGNCPDLVPTVACVAAFAKGTTVINNVSHLRIKESDRMNAPAFELGKVGVRVETGADTMRITGSLQPCAMPANPQHLALSAHNDHRIAMSLSLLAFAGYAPEFDNPDCVNKSFPNFWKAWETILKGNRA